MLETELSRLLSPIDNTDTLKIALISHQYSCPFLSVAQLTDKEKMIPGLCIKLLGNRIVYIAHPA